MNQPSRISVAGTRLDLDIQPMENVYHLIVYDCGSKIVATFSGPSAERSTMISVFTAVSEALPPQHKKLEVMWSGLGKPIQPIANPFFTARRRRD